LANGKLRLRTAAQEGKAMTRAAATRKSALKRAVSLLMIAVFALAGALFEHFSLSHQRLQKVADWAASAGLNALARGENPEARVRAKFRRRSDLKLTQPAIVESPPRTGSFAGHPDAVRVSVSSRWHPPLIGGFSVPMNARTTSLLVPAVPGRPQGGSLRVE
jgi:hypothetical protein